jgi:ABC-2 type transport system ATP-binding protein
MNDAHVIAHEVGKSFQTRAVLESLSFEVRPGDVVGVLGKNGAGKTTLLELMLGFTRPTSGTLQTFGHESFRLPAAAKARVGFVPQEDELVDQLTAADQLSLVGSFYSSWNEALLTRLAREWEIDATQRIGKMSVGQRQKLSILLALGHRPDLLILDEPVASLDPLARRQFLEQIVDIAADGTRSVVFSTHIVSDVERLANRIWILKEGRLHWDGDPDSLKESVVRLHLRGVTAEQQLPLDNVLSLRREGACVTAVVSDWQGTAASAWLDRADVELEVEQLGLEEIFLELHR